MPFIYNKLTQNKESLLKRYINTNKKWWEWATIRNLEIFTKNINKPKIFVPVMDRSLKSRYSFTDKKVFGSGDVLIITNRESKNIDLKFLLAWLNSRSISLWYSIKGSKSGHRIKYTQSYVSNIPFFDLNLDRKEVSEIYREIIKLVDIILKQKNVKASEIEEKIDLALERLLKII
jgi:pantothenate kinase